MYPLKAYTLLQYAIITKGTESHTVFYREGM